MFALPPCCCIQRLANDCNLLVLYLALKGYKLLVLWKSALNHSLQGLMKLVNLRKLSIEVYDLTILTKLRYVWFCTLHPLAPYV